MKWYFYKFILWQLWCTVADLFFFGYEMALLMVAIFLIVDIICLCAYHIRKKKGVDVAAFLKKEFDFLPYKWFWIAALVGVVSIIHWEEYTTHCIFLWVTFLVAFVVDTIDRYHLWKQRYNESLS